MCRRVRWLKREREIVAVAATRCNAPRRPVLHDVAQIVPVQEPTGRSTLDFPGNTQAIAALAQLRLTSQTACCQDPNECRSLGGTVCLAVPTKHVRVTNRAS